MSQDTWFFSQCLKCGWREKGLHLKCPICGGVTVLEYEKASLSIERNEASIWRYRGLLPGFPRRISMGEGLTPLRVVNGVLVKNERKNPTGSYSDRASSIIASYLASTGRKIISVEYVEDFAYSVTYYTRGLVKGSIVVNDPFNADVDELISVHRAGFTIKIGDKGEADIPYINPLTIEGLKTILLEIYERKLRSENVIVPVETGTLAFSLCKALKELSYLGIDPGYVIIGAMVKGAEKPWLIDHCGSRVKIEEVDKTEALGALLELSRIGVRTKMVSALAYAVAKTIGNSIAVITVGEKHVRQRRNLSKLGSEILGILEKQSELTAYEVWKILGRYSLRGVYKALKSLEELGLVCGKHVVKGVGRKVKTYSICEDSYIVE